MTKNGRFRVQEVGYRGFTLPVMQRMLDEWTYGIGPTQVRYYLLEGLQAVPLVVEAWRQMGEREVTDPRFRLRSALDIYGDTAGIAGTILSSRREPGLAQELDDVRACSVVFGLLSATPFLWLEHVCDAIPRAPAGTGILAAELPFDTMWWTHDGDVLLDPPRVDDDIVSLSGYLIHRVKDEIALTVMGRDALNRLQVHVGRLMPQAAVEMLAGRLAFINSPHIDVEELRVDRASRRRAARAGGVADDGPIVRCITLRRPGSNESSGPRGSHSYHSRWTVRGHYRHQWFPSLQAHLLRWIDPHVKGPAGAPIKPVVYKVAR